MKKNAKGFTVLEVLVASVLFTLVVLGITQAVLAAHRYARSNLCKTHAHLVAMSYFEQILGEFHPYELSVADNSTLNLYNLKTRSAEVSGSKPLQYNIPITPATTPPTYNFDTDPGRKFYATVYNLEDDLEIQFNLVIKNSPLYEIYPANRTTVNPPIGFQSIHLTYRWSSPTATNIADANTWPTNQLYAIRPLQPDDPED